MAQRTCRVCYQSFDGRRDARTCSPRCRKRLSRTRQELTQTNIIQASETYYEPEDDNRPGGVITRLLTARQTRHLILALAGALAVIALSSGGVVASISYGYLSEDPALSRHMAVMLTGETKDGYPLVKATDTEDASRNALGVAVGLSDSLLAVSPVNTGVYVVNTGPVEVYVSDLNGAPKVGDLLAVSPIKGILMKSTDETVATFGVAMEDFDAGSAETIAVKANDGSPLDTKVALMNINVNVAPPLKAKAETNDDWLKSMAYNITGQQLSGIRIIAILMVFFTMMVIVSEIIYGVISGSINALGRNPLAREAITRQSFRSLAMAGLGMAFGTVIIIALIFF